VALIVSIGLQHQIDGLSDVAAAETGVRGIATADKVAARRS
jgi:hypothetical protein